MRNRILFLTFSLLLTVLCQHHEVVYVTTTITKLNTIHHKVLAPKTTYSTTDTASSSAPTHSTSISISRPRPSLIPYSNTSHPLVQFRLDCNIDSTYCNKVNKAVGEAIDELTRVIYIKNSLL